MAPIKSKMSSSQPLEIIDEEIHGQPQEDYEKLYKEVREEIMEEKEKTPKLKKKVKNTELVELTKKAELLGLPLVNGSIDCSMEAILMSNQSDGTNVSLFGLIIMIWTDDILIPLLSILDDLEKLCLTEHRYIAKRAVRFLRVCLQAITREMPQSVLENCSLELFAKALCEGKSYTIFCKKDVDAVDVDFLSSSIIKLIQDHSASLPAMETTIIESTTVPSVTEPAVANSSTISSKKRTAEEAFNDADSDDDIIAAFSLPAELASNTSVISQSIARRKADKLFTWQSPGERGIQVVKLDIYNFDKISGLRKDQWWRMADTRMTFLISSPADPKMEMVQKLSAQAARDVAALKNVKSYQREVN